MHREPNPISETGTGLRSLGGPFSSTPAGRVTLSPKELCTNCIMARFYGLSLFPGRGYNPIAILKLSGKPLEQAWRRMNYSYTHDIRCWQWCFSSP